MAKSLKSIEISKEFGHISCSERHFSEEGVMRHVVCPVCGSICIKYGKTGSGAQRWFCKSCKVAFSPQIDNSAKRLQIFLDWLFSKKTQKEMPGEGRTFRRKTSEFWKVWPMPPKVEEKRDVVYVDGIYLGRKACILICCDDEHVLGWYLCREEHSMAWEALMSRIAEPSFVVTDGGTGFSKALKKVWPKASKQRCTFHAFSQVRRYTTTRPRTAAGIELYALSRELLYVEKKSEADDWTERFRSWVVRYKEFLSQRTRDENGNLVYTHERLLKAENSLIRLLKEGSLFRYTDEQLRERSGDLPATNNRIEGGVNARLREMLREHRGLSIERRIKAVFWWCYMHSPRPLSATEILKVMPTDKSISDIYRRMSRGSRLEKAIPGWGDAVVWEELHRSSNYPELWS